MAPDSDVCTYVDMLGNVLDAIFVNSEECSGSVKSCTGWKRIKKFVLLVADMNYGVPKYTECAGNEPDVMLLGNAQKVLEEDQQFCSFGLRYNYGFPMYKGY